MSSLQNNKVLFYGSLSALVIGAAGTLYYLLSSNKNKNTSSPQTVRHIERQTVIQVLKKLKKLYYPTFYNIAMFALQIREQSQGKIPQEELREILLNQPHVTQELADIQDKVYEKFGITDQEFQYACNVLYKDDSEIAKFQNEMKVALDQAALGVRPQSQSKIPSQLTPEKTLSVLKQIMMESAKKIREAFQELKDEGEDVNLQNPRVLQALNNLKLEELKKKIIQDQGLEDDDDDEISGLEKLQLATEQFTRQNSNNFKDNIQKLELVHQKTVEEIFRSQADVADDFVEKSFASLDEELNKNKGNQNKSLEKGLAQQLEQVQEKKEELIIPEVEKEQQQHAIEDLIYVEQKLQEDIQIQSSIQEQNIQESAYSVINNSQKNDQQEEAQQEEAQQEEAQQEEAQQEQVQQEQVQQEQVQQEQVQQEQVQQVQEAQKEQVQQQQLNNESLLQKEQQEQQENHQEQQEEAEQLKQQINQEEKKIDQQN